MSNTWKAKWWRSGEVYKDWVELSGSSYQNLRFGYAGENANHVLEIAFTAVDDSYSTIALRWQNDWSSSLGYVSEYVSGRTFRYKVSGTSGDTSYINADLNAQYDGTFVISEGLYGNTTVTFSSKKGFIKGRTYYIYIFSQSHGGDNFSTVRWGYYSTKYYTAEDLTAFVEKQGGTVPIKVDGVWVDAIPQVKVSGTWTDLTPQVKVDGVWSE